MAEPEEDIAPPLWVVIVMPCIAITVIVYVFKSYRRQKQKIEDGLLDGPVAAISTDTTTSVPATITLSSFYRNDEDHLFVSYLEANRVERSSAVRETRTVQLVDPAPRYESLIVPVIKPIVFKSSDNDDGLPSYYEVVDMNHSTLKV